MCIKFFVKQFSFSSIAKRLGNPYFVFSSESVPCLYEQLGNEKKLNVGKTIYPEPVMYWMGYLLAVTALSKNIFPDRLYKFISPNELYLCYEAYHSLDIEDAIERIIESKSINKPNYEVFLSTRR